MLRISSGQYCYCYPQGNCEEKVAHIRVLINAFSVLVRFIGGLVRVTSLHAQYIAGGSCASKHRMRDEMKREHCTTVVSGESTKKLDLQNFELT